MGLINYSNISDGTTIDASDVNNPFNTIYNEFNGNIEAANIKNGTITQEKLANYADTSWSRISAANTVTSVTNNGNRSVDVAFTSSVATFLSPGMRIRTTRTVAGPTQSTSLNGTTQYWSKSSPTGITFTDDFVVSAWVKISSYGASQYHIASRYNGTSGWDFNVQTTGQIQLTGYNGGAANQSNILSYQSIPLNKWVHVTAQLDMSSFTNTSTTSYIMIDGVDVPALVSRAGTNPTALVQAGNLEIGSWNGGLQPLNGKIAQVCLFSAKVTQATIRSYMNQQLAGNETNLIGYFKFNGDGNDSTSNANNLTANGSAVATNADAPFGYQADGTISSTLDYGIVTKVATTTATVQVPEGCAIPTSGGISAVDYSTQKIPFGFPASKAKWDLEVYTTTNSSQASPVTATYYNVGNLRITIPIGSWIGRYFVNIYADISVTPSDVGATLSTTSNSNTHPQMSSRAYLNTATSIIQNLTRSLSYEVDSQTTYYLLGVKHGGTLNNLTFYSDSSGYARILFENAYL